MKTLVITLLILIQSGPIFAQNTFEKVYQLYNSAYELGKQVQQTSDGGFLVSGITYTFEDSSPFLFKTDANGDSVWLKNYDALILTENTFKAIETPDGGFLCGPSYGEYYITGFGHFYLMKTDSEGNLQWEEIFDANVHDQGTDFIIDSESRIILSGFTADVDFEVDLALLVTDLQGNIDGRYVYAHPEEYYPVKILELSSGGFAIAGIAGQGEELFIQKLDDSFNEEWIKTYPMGDELFSITSLQMTPDGDILLTVTVSLSEGDEYKNSILKIDDSGELQESIEIDFTIFPVVMSAFMPDENHLAITGWVEGYSNFSESVFLSKVTTEGEVIWERYFNVSDHNIGVSLNITDDNGYIINGTISYEGYSEQIYLIKTDEQGMISGIEEQLANASPFKIFPNPVKDLITLNLEKSIKATHYSIYNIQGQHIASGVIDNQSISVAKLKNGLYFIELTTNKGILRQKFIK